MNTRQFDALCAAAEEGVRFDGLSVDATPAGYTFETPETAREGLSDADLDAVAREHEAYVTNWYFFDQPRSPDRQAFLRWLEGADETPVPERYDALADGVTREWGEVLVTVTLGEDGERRYDVRNHADAGVPLDELDTHDDPLDARNLVTYDDRGRYRPLKTARSLPTGWAFPDLPARHLLAVMDFVYPATVTNWYREREGDLDISHWRDTADRQTGIYGIVSELPDEAVEWVAAACCDDSQCVKRREWQLDGGTELAADGGAGAFPCREPCSLVVAAARKWTTLEREEERAYTFHLTPSEKEQVEAVIDAVADGRIDDIREADVYEGANRYRARYLRAKRFDEDGNLGGVPTDDEE